MVLRCCSVTVLRFLRNEEKRD